MAEADGRRGGAVWLRAGGLLALPAAAALLGLVLAGALAPVPALLALAAAAAAALALARRAAAAQAAERAAAERAAAERADRLARLADARAMVVDSVPDPLLLLDQAGLVAGANLAARQIFGGALEGRDLAAVVRHPDVLAAAAEVLAGRPGRMVEVTLADPVERIFAAHVEPLPAPDPEGRSAILLLHELTAIRRSEQMRADFVANASHELRTPLATLLGFIETLRGPARDDAAARESFLEIMHGQALRMTRLVQDLLSLSRIEATEHTRPTGRVDLVAVVEAVRATAAIAATAKGMAIAVAAEAGLPPAVADADQIAQVAQNLIDNAVKYGAAGTPVRVRLFATERPPAAFPRGPRRAVALAVENAGEGIAREHLPRLTERFYRVDTARSRALGGTGLGLAIVKHIVARHRGALAIDSRPKQGATFTVYLPAAE